MRMAGTPSPQDMRLFTPSPADIMDFPQPLPDQHAAIHPTHPNAAAPIYLVANACSERPKGMHPWPCHVNNLATSTSIDLSHRCNLSLQLRLLARGVLEGLPVCVCVCGVWWMRVGSE